MTDRHAHQGRADAWWAERERQYQKRPEVQQEIERLRAEAQRQREQEDTRLERLEALADAGVPGAEHALYEAYTWQALQADPPEPSAKDDPEEWNAFFRQEYGRDMPLNAEYEAEKHRINAAAPADVGGIAAAYFEANDRCVFDPAELAAERRGIDLELRADISVDDPETGSVNLTALAHFRW